MLRLMSFLGNMNKLLGLRKARTSTKHLSVNICSTKSLLPWFSKSRRPSWDGGVASPTGLTCSWVRSLTCLTNDEFGWYGAHFRDARRSVLTRVPVSEDAAKSGARIRKKAGLANSPTLRLPKPSLRLNVRLRECPDSCSLRRVFEPDRLRRSSSFEISTLWIPTGFRTSHGNPQVHELAALS